MVKRKEVIFTETKKEKFIRLAENRTNMILNSIISLSKLSNKNNYDYNSEDIKKIFKAIDNQIKMAKIAFKSENKSMFKFK